MANIIDHSNFLVNINYPQEFGEPIDLETVHIFPGNVFGKDGIFFISLQPTDTLANDWKGETVDRWSFMNEIHRDEAFEKLIRKKYRLD